LGPTGPGPNCSKAQNKLDLVNGSKPILSFLSFCFSLHTLVFILGTQGALTGQHVTLLTRVGLSLTLTFFYFLLPEPVYFISSLSYFFFAAVSFILSNRGIDRRRS
jgi:hypothetical protein